MKRNSPDVQLCQIDDNNAIIGSDNGSYLFHSPSLRIFRIDKRVRNTLIAAAKKRVGLFEGIRKSSYGKRYLEEMIDMGLFEKDSPELISSTWNAYYMSKSSFTNLTLNLSHRCNLGCKYCYAGKGEYQSKSTNSMMSPDIAIRAIEVFLESNVVDNSPKFIDFSGGEPLLNMDVLKKCVHYLKKRLKDYGEQIILGVITNGVLLTKNILNFFGKQKIGITVSIDGEEEGHDLHRVSKDGKGTYKKIVENIARLPDRRPELFSARVTITPGNLNIKRIFDHLEELGFREYSFDISFGDFPDPSLNWDESQMKEYDRKYGIYMRAIAKLAPASLNSGLIYLLERLDRIHNRRHHSIPCRMSKYLLVVTPDGDFYPCYRLPEIERFNIGSIDSGIDQKRRKELFPKLVFEKERCRICWARYLCGGGCPAVSFIENGEDMYPDRWICRSRLISWKWFLWLYIKLKEDNFDFKTLSQFR